MPEKEDDDMGEEMDKSVAISIADEVVKSLL
jgi:hypothetical protein